MTCRTRRYRQNFSQSLKWMSARLTQPYSLAREKLSSAVSNHLPDGARDRAEDLRDDGVAGAFEAHAVIGCSRFSAAATVLVHINIDGCFFAHIFVGTMFLFVTSINCLNVLNSR